MLFYLVWAYNDRYNCENPSERADELPYGNEEYEEIVLPVCPPPLRGGDDWGEQYDDEADSKSENDNDHFSNDSISDVTKASKGIELMVAPDGERTFIEEIVLKLLEHVSDPLMRAELNREIGRFDEVSEMLKQVSSEDNFLIRFKRAMTDYIAKKETKAIDLTVLMYACNED